MSDDVVQHQRIASGYVPGLSEAGHPAAGGTFGLGTSVGTSAKLQNCTVLRPAGTAVGVYDILVGGSSPAPVGLGGPLASSFPNPPLVVAPVSAAGQIVQQGRCRVQPRSLINSANPPVAAGNPDVQISVLYGATLGAVPIYAGFSNAQLFRVTVTSNLGGAAGVFVLTDVDFDFDIERVLDPSTDE